MARDGRPTMYPSLDGFTDEARRSATLPGARIYSDPAILDAERERIFFRTWQYAAHASQVAEPGAFVTLRVLDQGIVVLRGTDGALRAFYNVCQHRAHELLKGSGCIPVITCPYHSWSYGLDGRLRTARGSEATPGFDARSIGLKPVAVDHLLDMVFVNLDPDAASLAETYPGLAEEIVERTPWLKDARPMAPADAGLSEPPPPGLDANWKVLAENCLECYHCEPAHPAFVDLVDIESYRVAVHGNWISSLSRAGRPDNAAYPFKPTDPSLRADFWFLWPNLTLNVLPGDGRFVIFRFEPAGPVTTRAYYETLCLPGTQANPRRDAYGRDVLWPEDKAICEAVQKGLASAGYGQGRFMVDRDLGHNSEHGVHQFQLLWSRAMGLVP
jgi:choline monooxygenase